MSARVARARAIWYSLGRVVFDAKKLSEVLEDLRQHDSLFWRRAIEFGANHGSIGFVRWSPKLFGLAFAAALPDKRRLVRENLRRALGRRSRLEEDLDVARVFTNYASSLTEAFLAVSERSDLLQAHCKNDEHYVDAVAQGKGVIVATAHTGGWQLAGQLLRKTHRADVMVVMRRERDARAQALQDAVRNRGDVTLVHIGDDPLDALPLLGHLRKRGIVAVQADRVHDRLRARTVELFGEPWQVPEGPLKLAAISGAPIVPVFTRRLGFMDYEVEVAPSINLPKRPTEADLDRGARTLANEMEKFVVAHATQWFHFE